MEKFFNIAAALVLLALLALISTFAGRRSGTPTESSSLPTYSRFATYSEGN